MIWTQLSNHIIRCTRLWHFCFIVLLSPQFRFKSSLPVCVHSSDLHLPLFHKLHVFNRIGHTGNQTLHSSNLVTVKSVSPPCSCPHLVMLLILVQSKCQLSQLFSVFSVNITINLYQRETNLTEVSLLVSALVQHWIQLFEIWWCIFKYNYFSFHTTMMSLQYFTFSVCTHLHNSNPYPDHKLFRFQEEFS